MQPVVLKALSQYVILNLVTAVICDNSMKIVSVAPGHRLSSQERGAESGRKTRPTGLKRPRRRSRSKSRWGFQRSGFQGTAASDSVKSCTHDRGAAGAFQAPRLRRQRRGNFLSIGSSVTLLNHHCHGGLALQVDTAEFDGAFEIPACASGMCVSSRTLFCSFGRIWSPFGSGCLADPSVRCDPRCNPHFHANFGGHVAIKQIKPWMELTNRRLLSCYVVVNIPGKSFN